MRWKVERKVRVNDDFQGFRSPNRVANKFGSCLKLCTNFGHPHLISSHHFVHMARKGQAAYRRKKLKRAEEMRTQETESMMMGRPVQEYISEEDDSEEGDEHADGDSAGQDDASKGKRKGGGYQVLPVAEIDEDWEGEPMDGATYLALAL